MADKLKPATKAWFRRQERWRHNGHIGSAHMMIAQCRNIIAAETTSSDAKRLAKEIGLKANDLALALKTRLD